jgi:hypothetical protein
VGVVRVGVVGELEVHFAVAPFDVDLVSVGLLTLR